MYPKLKVFYELRNAESRGGWVMAYRYTILCAILYSDVLCYAMCYIMLYYAILYILCYAICCVILCYTMLCAMLYNALLCYTLLCYTILPISYPLIIIIIIILHLYPSIADNMFQYGYCLKGNGRCSQ